MSHYRTAMPCSYWFVGDDGPSCAGPVLIKLLICTSNPTSHEDSGLSILSSRT